jgi:methionyl-tRNA formyltransferase
MKISLVCSDRDHPIYPQLRFWAQSRSQEDEIELHDCLTNLTGGDILFLVSCHELIGADLRKRFRKTLVLHASDLPRGRGWSPHIWAILDGQDKIVVSLIEAVDSVDAGPVWAKTSFELGGHELYDEINTKLFQAELDLMDYAIKNFTTIKAASQPDAGVTYYPRRTPNDSRIDIQRSIGDQFALLRVADPKRYPAFFEKDGHVYEVTLRKRPR